MQSRLLEIGKRVLAENDVRRVLTVAVDGVVELCAAERGMILLFVPGGEALFEEARGLGRLEVRHGRGVLLVSPADKNDFLRSLAARTHHLDLRGGCTVRRG